MKLSHCKRSYIEHTDDLELDVSFSDVSIRRSKNIDLQAKHNRVSIGSVHEIRGEGSFSSISIDTLVSLVDLELRHAGAAFEIHQIMDNFKWINLESSFTSVKLNLPDKTDFSYEFRSSYGSISCVLPGIEVNDDVSEKNIEMISGKKGKNTDRKVYVSTRHGSIRVR